MTNANDSSQYASQQQITNSRTGKVERVFVTLQAVYPNDNDEMSFDELRAKARGWFDRDWAAETRHKKAEKGVARTRVEASTVVVRESKPASDNSRLAESRSNNGSPNSNLDSTRTLDLGHTIALDLGQTVAIDLGREGKADRPKKIKVKEVKGETQTSRSIGLFGRDTY